MPTRPLSVFCVPQLTILDVCDTFSVYYTSAHSLVANTTQVNIHVTLTAFCLDRHGGEERMQLFLACEHTH